MHKLFADKVKESQKAKLWHSRDNERSEGRLARSYNQRSPPNDRRRSSKNVLNKALLLKRVLNCSHGVVIPHRVVLASTPHKVVKKIGKAAVDRFKLMMKEPGHFR